MLQRVVSALLGIGSYSKMLVVIEPYVDLEIPNISRLVPKSTAASSARAAVLHIGAYPVLITTGDHALLTPEMVRHALAQSVLMNADVTVGLATADTILGEYPATKRTFFKLGKDRVSGCNLFTVHSDKALKLFDTWEKVERLRKRPLKLVAEFGIWPLLQLITGRLTIDKAFDFVSRQTGATVKPLLLPFAEAAIDVDKPEDKELAEQIIAKRSRPT